MAKGKGMPSLSHCVFTVCWWGILLAIFCALGASVMDATDRAEHNSQLAETSCTVHGGQLNSRTCSACPKNAPSRRSEVRRENDPPPARRDSRRRSCTMQEYTCFDVTFSVSLDVPRSQYGSTKDLVNTTTTLPAKNTIAWNSACEMCYTSGTANSQLEFWTSDEAPKPQASSRSSADSGVRCYYHPGDAKGTVTFKAGEDDAAAAVTILVVIMFFLCCCFGGAGCFMCYMVGRQIIPGDSNVSLAASELDQEMETAPSQALEKEPAVGPQVTVDLSPPGWKEHKDEEDLPEGWKETKDDEGTPYYYKGRHTQYEFPTA